VIICAYNHLAALQHAWPLPGSGSRSALELNVSTVTSRGASRNCRQLIRHDRQLTRIACSRAGTPIPQWDTDTSQRQAECPLRIWCLLMLQSSIAWGVSAKGFVLSMPLLWLVRVPDAARDRALAPHAGGARHRLTRGAADGPVGATRSRLHRVHDSA
jgi:hypothetical protein